MEALWSLFSSTNLSPHGYCLLWRPGLLGLHIVADAMIGVAYFSIPITLATFLRRRPDLGFGWIAWLFAVFILACGTTHIFGIWTLWHPDYGIEGLVKLFTGIVSLATAAVLWKNLPALIALPSITQISAMNEELQAEIRERRAAEQKLTSLNMELENRVLARTAELTILNRSLTKSEERFRQVVESTPSAMVMVDTTGRIEMINAQAETLFGYPRTQLMGRSIDVLVPERYRSGHPSLRAAFLQAPQSRPMGLGRDLYAMRHDGTEFPVEIGINPIDTDDGTKVLSMIVDISDRKQKEERISAALKEKDILLAEIHHRVKNNLQIVHSLLDLQSSRVTDTVARGMLRESRNRINSMAIVHQALYGSDDLRRVDFATVLRTLVPHLAASYALDEHRARVTIDAAPVHLPLNSAIPCGLIVNELVSNTFKHGFPEGTSGDILVSLQEAEDGEVILTVSDTGVGLPDSFDLGTTPSLGLKLVNLLASQLEGDITIEPREPTRFTLRFALQPRAGTTSE